MQNPAFLRIDRDLNIINNPDCPDIRCLIYKQFLEFLMKKIMLSVAAIALAGSMGSAVAADAAAGKIKAAVCAACHGANGISAIPNYPNLAGQKEAYIVKQLKAFKDGTRKDPVMAPMAAPLTDTDMANLAAFYGSLK